MNLLRFAVGSVRAEWTDPRGVRFAPGSAVSHDVTRLKNPQSMHTNTQTTIHSFHSIHPTHSTHSSHSIRSSHSGIPDFVLLPFTLISIQNPSSVSRCSCSPQQWHGCVWLDSNLAPGVEKSQESCRRSTWPTSKIKIHRSKLGQESSNKMSLAKCCWLRRDSVVG